MDQIIAVILIIVLLIEIWSYGRYVKSAEALTNLGLAMQEVFKGVSTDIEAVNQQLTLVSIRADRNDEVTDILNKNDALIEVYLNLFRDALGLEADQLNRIGTLKHPDPKN